MNKNAFPLTGLDYIKGDPIDLEKCKGNHVVVVEMWATWCPPCRTSIPHLTELAHKYKNVKFLGITSEGVQEARSFVERMGKQMDYTVASDARSGVSQLYMQQFNLQGIPSAIIVDKKGQMIWAGHPMSPEFEATLKKADAQASTASAPPPPQPEAPKHVLDLKKETHESLMTKTTKELKDTAAAYHISLHGLLEKDEIVNKLLQGK